MIRGARQPFGLVFAMLALAVQLAFGGSVPRTAPVLPDIAAICHAGDDIPSTPSEPAHQSPDCVFCFLCSPSGAPTSSLAAQPVFPAPRLVLIGPASVLPPATAPPVPILQAAQPRGPPIQA
jgi:hypothetical protein